MPESNYTEAKDVKPESVASTLFEIIIVSILTISIGAFLLFIPCIGLVGIILILFGLVYPFYRPFQKMKFIEGPCPYCGTVVRTSVEELGKNCRACKRRIVIRDKKFFRVD